MDKEQLQKEGYGVVALATMESPQKRSSDL